MNAVTSSNRTLPDPIDMNPLVTVVVPCYNAARWIEETIESVRRQTYERLEVLAIDDGSTDATLEILHSIEEPRLQVLANETNRGIAATRNRGIQAASGDYICFLDHDDYWLSQKVELQVDLMTADETVGVVYGDYYYIDQDGAPIGYRSTSDPPEDDVLKQFYLGSVQCPMVTKMIRYECFEEIGLLDERLYGADDQDLDLRILEQTDYAFRHIGQPLACKREHGRNASNEYLRLLDDFIYLAGKHRDVADEVNEVAPKKLADLYSRRAFRRFQREDLRSGVHDLRNAFRENPLEFKIYPLLLAPCLLLGRRWYLDGLEHLNNMATSSPSKIIWK